MGRKGDSDDVAEGLPALSWRPDFRVGPPRFVRSLPAMRPRVQWGAGKWRGGHAGAWREPWLGTLGGGGAWKGIALLESVTSAARSRGYRLAARNASQRRRLLAGARLCVAVRSEPAPAAAVSLPRGGLLAPPGTAAHASLGHADGWPSSHLSPASVREPTWMRPSPSGCDAFIFRGHLACPFRVS